VASPTSLPVVISSGSIDEAILFPEKEDMICFLDVRLPQLNRFAIPWVDVNSTTKRSLERKNCGLGGSVCGTGAVLKAFHDKSTVEYPQKGEVCVLLEGGWIKAGEVNEGRPIGVDKASIGGREPCGRSA